jgi:hypothetical protein
MLGLGLASYALVEQRLTPLIFRADWRRWAPGLAGAGAVLALSLAAGSTHGFEAARTAPLGPAVRALLADDRRAPGDWRYPFVCDGAAARGPLRTCALGDPAARQVLVIGDSHAEQFVARYAGAFGARRGVTFVTRDGCLPVPSVGGILAGGVCSKWALGAYAFAEHAGFRRIVILSSWVVYLTADHRRGQQGLCEAGAGGCPPLGARRLTVAEAFDRLAAEIRRLQARGAEVVLVGPHPQGPEAEPQGLYRRAFWGAAAPAPIARADFLALASATRAELQRISRLTGAPLVDPLDALCGGGDCTLYKDASHFRASAVMQPRFAYLDPWLAPGRSK